MGGQACIRDPQAEIAGLGLYQRSVAGMLLADDVLVPV